MEQEHYDEFRKATERAFKNLFLLNRSLHLSKRKKTKDESLFMKIMDDLGEACERDLGQGGN